MKNRKKSHGSVESKNNVTQLRVKPIISSSLELELFEKISKLGISTIYRD